ncbi:MAG: winged helix-turn-helix transcriptional regulator [Flavobacteriales bacterium]|nr:winged helix-turn-helix transcriptional regulator [Flavobacteriales bacterium]
MERTCIRALADHKQINRCKKKIIEIESELTMLASVVGLIGNNTRLKILYLLQVEKKLCVCDLSDILNMTVPAISQQLRKLKDGRIISSKREGTVIYYSLTSKYQKIVAGILNHSSSKSLIET